MKTASERNEGLRTAFDLRETVYPLPRRPARPGRRQVLPHFPGVVNFVYESRFATRSQIQRRFAAAMLSDRTAQYQLQSLVGLGLLGRTVVRGHAPDDYPVYFATRKGLSMLNEQATDANHSTPRTATEQTRAHGVSDRFILHELLITECDLLDWLTIQRSPHLQRLFIERRYFRKDNELRFEAAGKTHRLKPDSGSLIETAPRTAGQSPTALLHLKEIDKGTESFAKLLDKFQTWDRWAQSAEGRAYLRDIYATHGYHHRRPMFRLLVVAHANSRHPADDLARLVTILTAVQNVSGSLRRRIWLTTAADLQRHQHDPLPALAPIWFRARDAHFWPEELKQFAVRSPTERASAAKLRRLFANRMTNMQRCSLFARQHFDPPKAHEGRCNKPAVVAL